MADNDDEPDPAGDWRDPSEPRDNSPTHRDDAYELTAKDAGWHTPTLLVSPAKLVYFNPPRPRKRP